MADNQYNTFWINSPWIDDDDPQTLLSGYNCILDSNEGDSNEVYSLFQLDDNHSLIQSNLDDIHIPDQTDFNESKTLPLPIEANNVPRVTVLHVPSSLPASENWAGDYNFNVSFSQQKKNTKGIIWTYSKDLDKLYVGKDSPCPINFSTNTLMPENVKIRAMALYSSPESASEVVARCVNHSLEDESKNIPEAEHLVRCESSTASYEIDPSTGRQSVIVPFENPPAGQLFSTYIYKFACFSSCPYGPNRRPLMLVFTLEQGSEILGRFKVDVKICACPGRDRKSDEQQVLTPEIGSSKKRKEPNNISSDALAIRKEAKSPLPKKSKQAPTADGLFYINVKDRKCYEFLEQMKKLYDMSKMDKRISPDNRIFNPVNSSAEES